MGLMMNRFIKTCLIFALITTAWTTWASSEIEEVIVTANKREQAVQDIPMNTTCCHHRRAWDLPPGRLFANSRGRLHTGG